MKKILLVLAIGAFAACNNSAGDASKTDSTTTSTTTVDSPAVVAPDTSSMRSGDTTMKMQSSTDTTKKAR